MACLEEIALSKLAPEELGGIRQLVALLEKGVFDALSTEGSDSGRGGSRLCDARGRISGFPDVQPLVLLAVLDKIRGEGEPEGNKHDLLSETRAAAFALMLRTELGLQM